MSTERSQRAVAVAMVHGPEHGLALVERISTDERLARTHRVDAVRAHLHERAGQIEQAARLYRKAARRATPTPDAMTTTTAPANTAPDGITRRLLRCGLAAGPVFLGVAPAQILTRRP